MEKEMIKKLALTTATLIVDSCQRVISSWASELRVLKNIQISGAPFAGLLLEASIFGHYYIGEKFKEQMNEKDGDFFASELNEEMIFILAMALNSPNKKISPSLHEASIKKLYEGLAPEKHKTLANSKEGTIVNLFKEGIRQIFNENDFKIKFIGDTPENLQKLNSSKLLSDFGDDIFLENKIIYAISDALLVEFSTIDFNQLRQDIEE